MTVREMRPLMADKNALLQSGEIITHFSLITGVLFRDPTVDRRMIELCMQLPESQFVYRGTERRLVREYLKGYIPEEIRRDETHRGRINGRSRRNNS
jgi:asparagine synthase (glutamine-hydrolysing)